MCYQRKYISADYLSAIIEMTFSLCIKLLNPKVLINTMLILYGRFSDLLPPVVPSHPTVTDSDFKFQRS